MEKYLAAIYGVSPAVGQVDVQPVVVVMPGIFIARGPVSYLAVLEIL